jgi:phage shock protein A
MSGPATIDARATLADLTAQRAAAIARQRVLSDEREALAYDAATGDGPARKALDSLTREAATAALTLENLDAAIAEAKRRVAAADEEARLAELRRKAAEAQAKLADLDEIGRSLSASLAQFADTFERFQAVGDGIRRLGLGFVGRDLQRVNTVRAIDSVLARLHLSSRAVPPAQRVEIADLIQSWRGQVAARVAHVLGDDDREAA